MRKPVIGITIQKTNSSGNQWIRDSYVLSVQRAGGIPLLIPLGIKERDLESMMARIDGLLLSGGGDIEPRIYRSPDHPSLFGIDPERDRLELYLAKFATQTRTPFLAICRGIQVLNVALGGTLFVDIGDFYPNAMQHQFDSQSEREFLAHRIDLVPGSYLHQMLVTSPFWVNSLHHQGINKLGKGLVANAYAPDHLVEGVELAGHPFGIGVQWHPECLLDSPQTVLLFETFVRAAKQRLF